MALLAVATILFFVFKEKIMSIISPPKLSEAQKKFIQELHPAARDKFARLVADIEKKTGWRVTINSGYRSYAEQAVEYQANSKNAKPGYSYHNYGLALDLNVSKGKVMLMKNSSDAEWEASGVPALARSMGFRWGGDLTGYQDAVHFDLGNKYDINKLRQLAVSQFGTNPANVIGNQVKIS